MAQTRKRRRRKHRGTQGGRIDRGRRPKPRSRAEAQARARSRSKAPRGDRPPTWRSATWRATIISGLLVATLIVFHKPIVASVAFGVFALTFYVPMGYYLDRALWRRRQRQKMRDD
jgi:hypothetical protein